MPTQSPTPAKEKKPLYKKWWFWLIVAIVLVSAFGGQGGKKSSNQTAIVAVTPTSTPLPTPTATPNAPADVLRVASLIGIDPATVSSVDGGYEAMYEFVILTFAMDGDTVSKVISGDYVFYENGEALNQVQDIIPSLSERMTAQDNCKELVNSILKAPSTAEYPGTFISPFDGWNFAKSGNVLTASSYVDSQNSFGAMIRSDFILEFDLSSDSWSVLSFSFDGKKIK